MTLSVGVRLGPYEVLGPLGAGGMGEVYRAKDTRLDRSVAIKVLPSHLSSNPDLRARFEREARAVSSLNHPHICTLHDVGHQDGTDYIVMELVEGETLLDRLKKGPLSLDQTLRYGIEIADALDKAHRYGVVHRDLKPGNVMLTKAGSKLMDFGLAKRGLAGESGGVSSLPTQERPLTEAGSLLGTYQYMSPEQLEGKDADARADIWALGCVLYEMVTGKRAFEGKSQASLISAIMTSQPQPIAQLQPMTPPAFDRLVKVCLAKDPDDRWQSARDLVSELRWLTEAGAVASRASMNAHEARRGWRLWAIAAVSVLAALGVAFAARRATAPEQPRMQFSIVPPERTALTDFFALSPDGKAFAYSGTAGGKSLLRIRDLASGEVRALPETDSSETVFWSPDGRSLGFVSRGKLRRVDVATGSIEPLADAQMGRGGSWGTGGDILFAQKAAIYRVAASGGPATPVTSLEKGDLMHRWPQVLPDGKRFLFFVKTGDPETTGTYLASIGAPVRKLVLRNGATGVFVPPDTLLFGRGSALLAQRFDLGQGRLLGAPEAVARPVLRAEAALFVDNFTVSDSGILVFRPGSAERQLTWLDRRGSVLQKIGAPAVITSVSLAPGDREVAITLRAVETGQFASSIIDLDRGVTTPFGEGAMPAWTPDGRDLLYRHDGQSYEIRKKAAHGDPKDEPIGVVGSFANPSAISSDGRYLLFTRMGGNFDVGVKDLRGGEEPKILLGSEFDERCPHFSPDGRWFVYSSDEPGQTEIFVRRFPPTEGTWRISAAGGRQPTWSRDGKEIFFLAPDGRLMAAPVSTSSTLLVGGPQALFSTTLRLNSPSNQYAVSADGQRFLALVPTQDVDAEPFRVLVNWRTKP